MTATKMTMTLTEDDGKWGLCAVVKNPSGYSHRLFFDVHPLSPGRKAFQEKVAFFEAQRAESVGQDCPPPTMQIPIMEIGKHNGRPAVKIGSNIRMKLNSKRHGAPPNPAAMQKGEFLEAFRAVRRRAGHVEGAGNALGVRTTFEINSGVGWESPKGMFISEEKWEAPKGVFHQPSGG